MTRADYGSLETIKKILRYVLPALYIGLFFPGTLQAGNAGLAIHFVLVMVMMWTFVRRKLPVKNYALAGVFILFLFSPVLDLGVRRDS